MPAEIKGTQFDLPQVGGVARQIDVVVAPSVEEVEDESGDPPPRRAPQVVDGGIPVIERRSHARRTSPPRVRAG